MALYRQFSLFRIKNNLQSHKWTIAQFCTKPDIDDNEKPAKTITERFNEAIKLAAEKEKLLKEKRIIQKAKQNQIPKRGLQPVEGYTPRFEYNGYLKNCTWRYYDEETMEQLRNKQPIELTEEQIRYRNRKKRKYCLLLGFAGANYYGMQFNKDVKTIEGELLKAMCKNNWILEEHLKNQFSLEFEHGSRTDRAVSAARMNCSLLLPEDLNIEDVNRDLPSDIRLFGMKRATRKFSARHNCSARTYAYTLPTIAFAQYNDQCELVDYRVPIERLERANQVLQMFQGQTNFHNFTIQKQHFDRSAQRRIEFINCSEPFVESGIEFAKITVKGESFMYHQIRKMVGTALAVIRGIVNDDLLARTLTAEKFYLPLAPGLGLMLERLHFTQYMRNFPNHDPLTFEDCDEAVEKFRREKIHPIIIETEVKENSMREWLELLCVHTFDPEGRMCEEGQRHGYEPEYDDFWGEDPEFIKKFNEKYSNDD